MIRTGKSFPASTIALLLLISAGSATGRDKAERAPQLQKLVDCKVITNANDRLACYDREVAVLDAAEQSKELVVIEKQKIRQAQRSAFGLSLPQVDALAGDDAREVIKQIESKVGSARQGVDGWRIALIDGSVWQQTDDKSFFRDPKPGQAVVVTRGTFGSFFLRVGDMPGIKVRRIG